MPTKNQKKKTKEMKKLKNYKSEDLKEIFKDLKNLKKTFDLEIKKIIITTEQLEEYTQKQQAEREKLLRNTDPNRFGRKFKTYIYTN